YTGNLFGRDIEILFGHINVIKHGQHLEGKNYQPTQRALGELEFLLPMQCTDRTLETECTTGKPVCIILDQGSEECIQIRLVLHRMEDTGRHPYSNRRILV